MSQLDKFLKSEKILRLVTIDENGSPHVVPVWYIYLAKKFYVGTNTKTKKAKNLTKNKKIAFCIDVGINSPDIYGVMGQGTSKIIKEKTRVKKIAKTILCRYFKTLDNKSAIQLLEDTDCIIEINPKKITQWSY